WKSEAPADLSGAGVGARSFGRGTGLSRLSHESRGGFVLESESGVGCKLGCGQPCVWLRAPRPGQHGHGGEYLERTLTRWFVSGVRKKPCGAGDCACIL